MLSSTGPRSIKMNGTVRFHLHIVGMKLDQRIGSKPKLDQGHIQVYSNRIPRDAYIRKDLSKSWIASRATSTFKLKFSKQLLHGRKGTYKILLALAKNNDMLYYVKAATFKLKVR